ncbi:MAG TPA: hypothetical protein VH120_17095 [Gemmataceae bacterium]|jgi:hypothetical protein|nr:hypothetical protein [Gemmataceae bacterium]
MTEAEWFACGEPDLLLEHLIGRVSRAQLVEFVRGCWQRITPLVTAPPHERTVVDQFADLAEQQDDLDAVTYAAEAVLKAAGWAPSIREEQAHQADLLRQIVGNPFRQAPRAGRGVPG